MSTNLHTYYCPALFISAPASGQGKTTVTAAIAYHFRMQGLRVRVFKTGPDFLDPKILETASGLPVYQLDLWMGDENHCRQLLYDAAGSSDLILIEGVMGFYDGTPSSADLAQLLGMPVLTVINASAMAQTFGAIVFGLSRYHDNINLIGVLANRVGSHSHAQMLSESLHHQNSVTPWFGWLAADNEIKLPERHLGLWQADEIEDLVGRIESSAKSINGINIDAAKHPLATLFDLLLANKVAFSPPAQQTPIPTLLEGKTIAVARDIAFTFLYHANLELLQKMGAKLVFFSPLQDSDLPNTINIDAIYLPGGYPELYGQTLADNISLKNSIREFYYEKKPIVAECGGMMFLMETLVDGNGQSFPMVGLIRGRVQMQKKLTNLGLASASFGDESLRGHSFHYSSIESDDTPFTHSQPARNSGRQELIFHREGLTASFIHWYFPSNPALTARLFLS